MRKLYSLGKRTIAVVLAMLMLFACGEMGLLQMVLADPVETVTITDGQLIAKQYTLSDAQTALLQGKLLKENSYTYEVPQDYHQLIEVDAQNRKISAKAFESAGLVWVPTRANVTQDSQNEPVSLQKEGDIYTGTFQTAGNTYSVSVTYALHIFVSEEQQQLLLQAGPNMKAALEKMETISQQQATLEAFAKNIDKLMNLVNGVAAPWGSTISYADESGAVKALYQQTVANGGDFDLVCRIKDYHAAAYESKFLAEQGGHYYDTAAQTATHILNLCKDRMMIETLVRLATQVGMDIGVTPELLAVAFDSLEEAGAALQNETAERWAVLDRSPLKDGMSDLDYLRLDGLLETMETEKPNVTVVQELLAQTVSLQVNMNRFNISVTYTAKVVDLNSADTTQLIFLESRHTARFTLNADSSYEEIIAAVSAQEMENRALADWAVYQVGQTFYDRTVTGISQGDSLQSDLSLTVSYLPKTYQVSGVEICPDRVPYGYNVMLPAHIEANMTYDYTINGTFYRQNTVYRVVGDTEISRSEGSAWVDTTWGNAVSLGVSPEAAAILRSTALNTPVLSLRKPGSRCISLLHLDKEYVISAPDADSGIKDLSWVAVAAWVVVGTEKYPVSNFQNGSGSFAEQDFDKVEVQYELKLNSEEKNDLILELSNLPEQLVQQSAAQKAAMQQLGEKKSILSQFGTYATLLKNLLKDERVGETAAMALTTIIENCINTAGGSQQLFLYEYLLAYEEKGLSWYYAADNYEKLNGQFSLLREQLGIFVDSTPELLAIMKDYLDGLEPGMAEEYYEKIDDMRKALDAISLTPPHQAIRRSAGELELIALVDAIAAADGKTQSYQAPPTVVMTELREESAPDKCTILLYLWVEEGKTLTIRKVFPLSHVLSEEDIAQLQQELNQMKQQLNLDEKYYLHIGSALPTAGTMLNSDLMLNYTWTLRGIPVYLEGEDQCLGSFTLTQPYLVLPGCTQPGFRYRYLLNDRAYDVFDTTLSVTLTQQEMDFLCNGGKIVRETVDIARQDMLDLVKALNEALANNGAISGAALIPVEDAEGNISIVFKLSPKVSGFNGKNVLSAIAQTLLMYTKYSYIDLGGYPLRADTQIYLQGIIDTLLDTDLRLSTLCDAINPDGTLKNMELPNHRVMEEALCLSNGNTVPDGEVLGALLAQTTLSVAANATIKPTVMKVYLTISDDGSNQEEFSKTRQGLEQLGKYLDIRLGGGSATLVLTLTDATYHKFLAAMVVSDQAQLGSINSFDYGVCVEYLYELLEPLLKDGSITTDTLENTAQDGGQTMELSAAQDVLKRIQEMLQYLDENVTYSDNRTLGNLYLTEGTMEADKMLGELPIPPTFKTMIAENGGVLTATFGIQLTNVDKKYQALLVDRNQPEHQKVQFVEQLLSALEKAQDGAVVILLENISGDIVTDKKLYLDLNGKTVSGNVSGGQLWLMDSTITNTGAVTGTVDPQVRDCRHNGLYTVKTEGQSIQVLLNPQLLTQDRTQSLRDAAAALAMDLIFSFYTAAVVKVDTEVIYQLQVQDLMALLENGGRPEGSMFPDSVKYRGLSKLLNQLFYDLSNYTAMAKAAADKQSFGTYALSSKAWDLSLEKDSELDMIVGSFTPAAEEKVYTLQLLLGGTQAQKDQACQVLTALAQTSTMQAQLELQQIALQQGQAYITAAGDISFTFRGSKNAEFAVLFTALLANWRTDKGQAIAALETWADADDASAMKTVLGNASVQELFAAIAALRADTDVAQLVAAIGLEEAYRSDLTALLEKNKPLLVYFSNQLAQLQEIRGDKKLREFEKATGVYDLSSAVCDSMEIQLLNGTIRPELTLEVELFSSSPSFEGGQVQVSVDGTLIYGSKVDTENRVIYLDVAAAGITVEQFNLQVVHSATNATQIKANFAQSSPDKKGAVLRDGQYYLVNGAKATFTASNPSSDKVAKVEYTVILLGDINGDSIVNVSDAVLLSNHIVGNLNLVEVCGKEALLASNLDRSAVINVADVVRIAYKSVNRYTSVL